MNKTNSSTHRKINIVLVSIINRNLGDYVIADTAEYYIQKALSNFDKDSYQIFRYNIYREDYELLRFADLIIFDGGGIVKFKQENFYQYTANILSMAQKYDIPVFLNCIGVESYDLEDERCQNLKTALNYSCIKGISVRDDIDTLKKFYIQNKDIRISKSIDPAIACPYVYQIQKSNTTNKIGLGIIRDQIFADYGTEGIDKEFQVNLWISLIRRIEEAGYEWQLFTNGLKSDQTFAAEVLERCGLTKQQERYLAPRSAKTEDLVSLISGYKAIVAGRMHSNIIAYSLGIPSIALVWNQKLNFWGERIGYPKRFISAEQLDADRIADALFLSIRQGVRKKLPTRICERRMQQELKYFVTKYGSEVQNKPPVTLQDFPWHKKLLAVSLGGEGLQYSSLNHLDSMKRKYRDGFRKFEADIRLTSDNKLVCVNGWTESIYEKLDLDPALYQESPPSYTTFMQSKYYGIYQTTDFAQLMDFFAGKKNISLILDIGRPNRESLDLLIEKLNLFFSENLQLLERIRIRVQTKYVCTRFLQTELPYQLIYYIPAEKKRKEYGVTLENIVSFCKKNQIDQVSLSNEVFNELNEKNIRLFHKNKIKLCVFTYNTYTDIKKAMERKADIIGTHHISIQMLKKLIAEEK
ncbi:MAG: polysaccharide pyruvyl transferase family protein [Clostridiaceae bacterium]|nr:polysaccharide pyruvyl transferase family protein [Clostridiaceae bacterium]